MSRRNLNPVPSAAIEEVRLLLGAEPLRRDLLIEYLHRIQDSYGFISADHLAALADAMKLSRAEGYEVATFYHHLDVVHAGEIPPPPLTVRVCDSIVCAMAGAKGLLDELRAALGDAVRVQAVPCVGRCEGAPVAVVGRNPIEQADLRGVCRAIDAGAVAAPQPEARGLADYRAAGGYRLYADCVAGRRDAADVIAALESANLRGLGGAGFPAGRKWRVVHDQPAPRLMAVNIDEGEPGTFKDRYYLEREPHRFLEGMLIAAWAVGIA
ncbi:MAG: NAD(P)H-dependent oxidoreductase subunit E, partial [Proteobacteria bacterium]|nr:NAD(P)H-dependent oxidoreductase subunit E [Pseudomonadota bacterium]